MFLAVFVACVVFTVAVSLRSRNSLSFSSTSSAFEDFQRNYLIVYFLMVAGDWLQGPYVYALYDAYGFSKQDIALLFVAGFGSSFIFGTFVGSLADNHGRKKFAMLYAVLYCMSCLTKHFNNFWILILGRIFGGIATSLLFR
jgi:MFS family permease